MSCILCRHSTIFLYTEGSYELRIKEGEGETVAAIKILIEGFCIECLLALLSWMMRSPITGG